MPHESASSQFRHTPRAVSPFAPCRNATCGKSLVLIIHSILYDTAAIRAPTLLTKCSQHRWPLIRQRQCSRSRHSNGHHIWRPTAPQGTHDRTARAENINTLRHGTVARFEADGAMGRPRPTIAVGHGGIWDGGIWDGGMGRGSCPG